MIVFSAHLRHASCTADPCDRITTGSVGLLVHFAFSAEWDGLAKTAVFRGSGKSVDVLLTGDECCVPPEVLTQPGDVLSIGVYGTDGSGELVIPTVYADAGRIRRGAEPSGIEPTPQTASLVEQLLAAAQAARDAAAAAEALAQSVRDDADAGAFDGASGKDAVVDATLSNAGEAADAAATGDVKHTADYAVTYAELLNSGAGLPIDTEWELGGVNTNGNNESRKYRVRTVGRVRTYAATRLEVKAGYRFLVIVFDLEGNRLLNSGWQTSGYTVEADRLYRIAIGATPEDTSVTADVGLYSAQISITNDLATDAELSPFRFPEDLELPLSIAHRGLASEDQVQNTIPAYEDAIAKGWRFLETDIRKTSDGVWVLLHDATIVSGVKIADITYAQALEYDLGNGTHIATLDELLCLCRRSHVHPVIEVKDTASITQEDADAIWAIVTKYDMADKSIFLAASYGGIKFFISKNPYLPVIQTSTSQWTQIPEEEWPSTPPSYTLEYATGKNKAFWAKSVASVSSKADMDNLIDYCHYWGIGVMVYCPTTQDGIDALSDRLDGCISQYVKYERERDYGSGGGGGGTSDYDELTDKPQINGVTLSGNKTAAQLGLEPEALIVNITQSGRNYAADKTYEQIRAAVSAGRRVVVYHNYTMYQLASAIPSAQAAIFVVVWQRSVEYVIIDVFDNVTVQGSAIGTYSKPVSGIPATDLASDVLAAYRTAADQDLIDAGKADKVSEITVADDGAVTQALAAGTVYHFTGALTALTLTLAAPAAGQRAQYHLDFVSGATAPTVTIPQSVTMPDGWSVEASTRYEIDVLDGYGVAQSWAQGVTA